MSYPQVVTQQPPAGAAYNAPRLWSSGTFSCFDDWKSCVMGYFCSICLAMQVSTNMGESACVPWVVPNAITVLRTKMRHMYNIEGTVLDDCCTAAFCGPCVWCQMAREQDYMEKIKN